MKPLYNEEQFNNTKSRDLLPFECEKCGKTFYGIKNEIQKYFSRIKRGINPSRSFKWCSKMCQKNGKLYNCKRCGKETYRTPTNFRNGIKDIFCSRSCSAIYTQRNGGHCHWSDEDKKRLSILAKNNLKFCGWNKGLKFAKKKTILCDVCNHPFIEKISIIKKRKINVCSNECRYKIFSKMRSENLSKQYKNGRKVYGGTTKWLIYKDIKVQGSYEYRTCKILDKWVENGKIKHWEYSKDRYEYVGIDNKKHNYLIDFKIWNNDDTFYYLEIKGYERENDKFKWNEVIKKGYKLDVWFLKDIIEKEEDLKMVLVA